MIAALLVFVTAAAAQEPLRPATDSVTFHEAVQRAMAFEVQASIAELAIEDARATEGAARSAVSPNVFVNVTYTHLDHKRGIGTSAVLAGRDQVNGQINAWVPAFAPHKWADHRLAQAGTQLAGSRHRDAKRTAAILAATAYLDVVSAKRAVTVAQQAVDTGLAHFAIAQSRYQAGIGNRLDVLRADDALGESQVLYQENLAAFVASKERLGVVLGRNTPADVADEWPARLDVTPELSRQEQSHVHERTDLRLAYEQLTLMQRTRQDAWLDYVPNLLATGQFFLQDPPTTQYPRHGWQLQAILTVPLFENGLRRGARAKARASEHAAHLQLDHLERQAAADLRQGQAVLARAEQAVRDAQRRREAASESVTLTARAYARGTITSLEVVDAERRGRDAATAAAVAEDAVRRARLNFLVAAGLFPAGQPNFHVTNVSIAATRAAPPAAVPPASEGTPVLGTPALGAPVPSPP